MISMQKAAVTGQSRWLQPFYIAFLSEQNRTFENTGAMQTVFIAPGRSLGPPGAGAVPEPRFIAEMNGAEGIIARRIQRQGQRMLLAVRQRRQRQRLG